MNFFGEIIMANHFQWYPGEQLKERRLKNRWTQAQVAQLTGLSRTQVIAMEQGVFVGGIRYLRKYTELVGLEISFVEKSTEFPQFNELAELFKDE